VRDHRVRPHHRNASRCGLRQHDSGR
jgi:hypothetical protein